MMKNLEDRERAILKMALSYAYANFDSFVEAFPYVSEAEPDGDKSMIEMLPGRKIIIDPPTDEEVNQLSRKMGLGFIV